MSRWFRHYAGMMRDDKLVRAAVRSRQSVERVVWVWGAVLESAAELNDAGRFDFDADEAAYFLRCDPMDLTTIVDALRDLGRIDDDKVTKWGDRQFDSDASRERQQRYRERKKTSRDAYGDVTRPSPDGAVTPQETDTETDKIDKSQAQHPRPARSRAELDEIERVCREAGGFQSDPSPGFLNTSILVGLIDAGCDPQLDLVPTIRQLSARARRRPTSWEYFREAALENAARRRELAAAGVPALPPGQTGPPRAAKPTLAAAFGQLATEMRQQREIRSGASDSGIQPPVLDLSAIHHG